MRRASFADPGPPDPEAGAVGVGTVIGLGLAAFFVYLLLGAFEGDSAHFGRVPIPSTSLVELPEGETDIFYSEAIELDPKAPLIPPSDLGYSIATQDGLALREDARGGDPEETDDGVALVLGAVFAPADGTYEVRVTSTEAARRITPELTFGQSPIQAVGERFDEVVEELKGPVGIVVAVILVLLFLLPSFRRATRRS